MTIKEGLNSVLKTIPKGVKLVAVSKYNPLESLLEAYNAGHRIFGENRVQELEAKQKEAPKDIEWHLIGRLQRNKVKYIVPYVDTIHSIDSEKLLKEVNKRAGNVEREHPIKVLFQVHVAQEETKTGFTPEELMEFIESKPWDRYPNVEYHGLMMMASNTDDMEQVGGEFEQVAQLMKQIQSRANEISLPNTFHELSMGMSHDYELAIQHGATIVRVGSKIFHPEG